MVAGSSAAQVHAGGHWIGEAAFHGEGAFWHGERGALLSVDMLSGDILIHDDENDVRGHIGDVAALVRRRAAGGYVAATERGFALLGDDLRVQHEIPVFRDRSVRMNEGACDAAGRLYCGSMAYDYRAGAGKLYRLDPDLSIHVVLDHVTIPNGLVWIADGTVALHADTADDTINAYEFDSESGAFGRRSVFVDFADTPGSPDGMALDADGGIWVAMWGGHAVRRYDQHGALTDVVPLPVTNPTSCAIGGESGTTLYITTSRHGVDRSAEPEAGRVYAVEIGRRGAEVAAFGG